MRYFNSHIFIQDKCDCVYSRKNQFEGFNEFRNFKVCSFKCNFLTFVEFELRKTKQSIDQSPSNIEIL